MLLPIILILVAAFLSAGAGGLLALRIARAVAIVIAAGAGIRIGAAFFDLIPEAVKQLNGELDLAMLSMAIGFLSFYLLEKLTSLHFGHESSAELDHGAPAHHHLGAIGAGGMGLHSLLDGVALAAALNVGGSLAAIITVVVVAHRFGDGISIVGLLLASHSRLQTIARWVLVVALAPILGVAIGLMVPLPAAALGVLLAFFAGFFLYIGAAELLPEAHRTSRSPAVAVATLGGVIVIYMLSLAVHALAVPY